MIIQDKFITLNTSTIFTRSWLPGDGTSTAVMSPPVILFHDSLGCVELWRTFPGALCETIQRPVIAYDRIGFGKSSPAVTPQPLDFIEKEAAVVFPVLLRHLGINKFIAFGHSVGGAIAVHCAGSFQSSCIALITESTQAFVEERTRAGILEEKRQFERTSKFERLKKYHGEKAASVFEAWTGTWLSPAFSTWSLKDVLPQVECPVLAIHGMQDEYGTIAHPEMIGGMVTGQAMMNIIPDCRHLPHREQERNVLETVTKFLKQNSLA